MHVFLSNLRPSIFSLVHFTKCDVTCWDHQVSLLKAALTGSDHGNIAIVIANAGISGQDSVFNDGMMVSCQRFLRHGKSN